MQHSYDSFDRPGGFTRVNLVAPLRHRDFALLWGGQTGSLIGDGVFLVAMAWQVYALSNAPTALSMVGIAMTVPTIVLLLIGGVVTDRFDRRRVLLAADVVRGVAVGLMAVLSLTGTLELWHMFGLVALYGAGTAFFGPAFDAIVPDLLPESELAQANSLDQFMRPICFRLAGPALGGWLVAGLGRRHGLRGRLGVVRAVGGDGAGDVVARVARERRPLGRGRPAAGLPVRTGQRVAVGHAGVGRGRLLPVPGAGRGAAPLRGQEQPARQRRGAGPGVRGRRPRVGGRGAGDEPRRPAAPQHHGHLRHLDAGHAGGGRVRAGQLGLAADVRELRVQRAGDGRHDRVDDAQAARGAGGDAGPRVQPGLADLDRPAADLVRGDGPGGGCDRRSDGAGRGRRGRRRW